MFQTPRYGPWLSRIAAHSPRRGGQSCHNSRNTFPPPSPPRPPSHTASFPPPRLTAWNLKHFSGGLKGSEFIAASAELPCSPWTVPAASHHRSPPPRSPPPRRAYPNLIPPKYRPPLPQCRPRSKNRQPWMLRRLQVQACARSRWDPEHDHDGPAARVNSADQPNCASAAISPR